MLIVNWTRSDRIAKNPIYCGVTGSRTVDISCNASALAMPPLVVYRIFGATMKLKQFAAKYPADGLAAKPSKTTTLQKVSGGADDHEIDYLHRDTHRRRWFGDADHYTRSKTGSIGKG
jgi:hypothetical protein